MLTGFCYLVAALSITEGDSLNTEEDRVGIAIKTINKEKKYKYRTASKI